MTELTRTQQEPHGTMNKLSTKPSGGAAHNDSYCHARHRSVNVSCREVRDHTNLNLKAGPSGTHKKTNGTQIELDGAVFLKLTVADAMCSRMVYVMPQVTGLLLSQKACKHNQQ